MRDSECCVYGVCEEISVVGWFLQVCIHNGQCNIGSVTVCVSSYLIN